MAQSLIPSDRRNGCIVDIGCGSSPLFLASSDFAEKIGLDKSFNTGIIESFASPNFKLIEHDIEKVGVVAPGEQFLRCGHHACGHRAH